VTRCGPAVKAYPVGTAERVEVSRVLLRMIFAGLDCSSFDFHCVDIICVGISGLNFALNFLRLNFVMFKVC